MLFAQSLARVASLFGTVEYFWLYLLGLGCAVVATRGSPLQGALGLIVGLGLSTVGLERGARDRAVHLRGRRAVPGDRLHPRHDRAVRPLRDPPQPAGGGHPRRTGGARPEGQPRDRRAARVPRVGVRLRGAGPGPAPRPRPCAPPASARRWACCPAPARTSPRGSPSACPGASRPGPRAATTVISTAWPTPPPPTTPPSPAPGCRPWSSGSPATRSPRSPSAS